MVGSYFETTSAILLPTAYHGVVDRPLAILKNIFLPLFALALFKEWSPNINKNAATMVNPPIKSNFLMVLSSFTLCGSPKKMLS
jgi:hypothetical protein